MTETADRLRALIAAEGPLTVGRFMELCVADYYARGTAFGAAGDFTTAPEISQTFGEMIGLWAAVVWQGMGGPHPLRLIELGPGRGTLMADLLRAARTVPSFAAALDIHLMETSPTLRDRQRAALGAIPATWHDDLDTLPEGPAIIVANEFFDALPIEQAERAADGWRLRRVALTDDDALTFIAGDAVAPATLRPGHTAAAPGDVVETSPVRAAVMRAIAARLATDGGAALIVDYGYARSAPGDTLQAVRDHAFADVLGDPGLADLTAHVDFEALAEAARDGGAIAHGPIPQGPFLRSLGIETRAATLRKAATPGRGDDIATGVRRLIAPEEMGTLFKVLAVTAPGLPPPPGFEDVYDDRV